MSYMINHMSCHFCIYIFSATYYDSRIPFNFSPSGDNSFLAPEYSCITPLRLLMLKETDDLAWKRLSLLMDHDEDRKKETDYQKMFQVMQQNNATLALSKINLY